MTLIVSDDYASLWGDGRGWSFYYGYEVTQPENPDEDEDAEWCFAAKQGAEQHIVPMSKLRQANPRLTKHDDPAEYLLTGIGLLVERGVLQMVAPPERSAP